MTKTALTLMAIALMAATALTAATAFAGPRKNKPVMLQQAAAERQVADAVTRNAQAMLLLKVQTFKGQRTPGIRLR